MNRLLIIPILIILLSPIFLSIVVYSYTRIPGDSNIYNAEPPLRDFIKITSFYDNPHFFIGDLNDTVSGNYYFFFNVTVYVTDINGEILQTVRIYRDFYGIFNIDIDNTKCLYTGIWPGFYFHGDSFVSNGYFIWILDYNETHFLLRVEAYPNTFIDTSCFLLKKTFYIDSRDNEGYFNVYNVEYVSVSGIQPETKTESQTEKLYILQGYTSRFLLRKSNYTIFTLSAKFYSNIEIKNVTYLNYSTLQLVERIGNVSFFYSPGGIITITSDTIIVPLILIHGDYLYVINRFVYDPNIGKYTFLFYEVYRIIREPYVITTDNNETIVLNEHLLYYPRDVSPPPPITYFNSLFASYDYNPGVGFTLTVKFATDNGSLDYYVDLNRILFYGLRLANITSINNLSLDDVIDKNLMVLSGFISTVSFYYYIVTNDPSVLIASQDKYLEVNAPINTTGLVYKITSNYNYISCSILSERLNISPTFLFCINFSTNGYFPVKPINQSEINVSLDTSQNLVKKYEIPAWYNLPGWFSLLAQVFSDTVNVVITVFKMLGQFLVLIFDRTIFTLIGLIIIFSHILIFLGNPSMLYGFYKDLIDMVVRFSHIIYDIIVKIATAVASIIEAINPF